MVWKSPLWEIFDRCQLWLWLLSRQQNKCIASLVSSSTRTKLIWFGHGWACFVWIIFDWYLSSFETWIFYAQIMVMKKVKLHTRNCVLLHVHVLLSILTKHESQIFLFTSIYISKHTNHLNTLVWMEENNTFHLIYADNLKSNNICCCIS